MMPVSTEFKLLLARASCCCCGDRINFSEPRRLFAFTIVLMLLQDCRKSQSSYRMKFSILLMTTWSSCGPELCSMMESSLTPQLGAIIREPGRSKKSAIEQSRILSQFHNHFHGHRTSCENSTDQALEVTCFVAIKHPNQA